MNYEPQKEIVSKVVEWLGEDGLDFFSTVLEEYGDLKAIIFTGAGIPHCVHFREGMQVRNFLRSLEETKDWSDHDYDNRWEDIIIKAIEKEKVS